jgi:phage shock protein A
MSYFSRLTDIVTCNLSQLLAEAEDPVQALQEIIAEMREGLAGAKRSVATASASEARIAQELGAHRLQIDQWDEKARQELAAGREGEARNCLVRKREVLDLIAGLEQQHRAAQATRDHLSTMQRALEARLAEATRRLEETGGEPASLPAAEPDFKAPAAANNPQREVDAELEQLKRQMGLR